MGAPELDARLLLRFVLGWSEADLLTHADEPLAERPRRRFEKLVRARAARRPLQHLTGRVEFFGIRMRVGREALIPRPDTEVLVETALARLGRRAEGGRVADVGCGSGCVALALAANLEGAVVFGVESSGEAMKLAARNLEGSGPAARVHLVRGDLLRAVRGTSLDAVVANLPYIPTGDIEDLEPEVRDHEPRAALDGGDDGLDPLRRLVPMAAEALVPRGWLIVEIGAGQRERARRLLEAGGFRRVEAVRDLAGIPRVLAAVAAG